MLCLVAIAPLNAATAKASSSMKNSVWDDSTRLAALLHDSQTSVSVSADVWKTIGNEANSLANRLYGHTAGNATARALARDARMHVREMRAAALAGNAAEARRHASEAMPFVNKLTDWSAPAKM
jgi:hypothetical protein